MFCLTFLLPSSVVLKGRDDICLQGEKVRNTKLYKRPKRKKNVRPKRKKMLNKKKEKYEYKWFIRLYSYDWIKDHYERCPSCLCWNCCLCWNYCLCPNFCLCPNCCLCPNRCLCPNCLFFPQRDKDWKVNGFLCVCALIIVGVIRYLPVDAHGNVIDAIPRAQVDSLQSTPQSTPQNTLPRRTPDLHPTPSNPLQTPYNDGDLTFPPNTSTPMKGELFDGGSIGLAPSV